MATIKAGTYRFNDVLSAPSEEFLQELSFSFTPVFNGVEYPQTAGAIWIAPSTADGGTCHVTYGTDLSFSDGNRLIVCENSIWATKTYGEGIQTITLPTDQEVSAEFYSWFTANTKMLIEAGTYRWNDVPTYFLSSADIPFTTPVLDVSGTTLYIQGTRIFNYEHSGAKIWYAGVLRSSYPDYDNMSLETEAYTLDEGWNRLSNTLNLNSEGYGQIITITSPTYVPTDFGLWAVENWQAYSEDDEPTEPDTTSAATITYNGSVIASLNGGQTATLKCEGMRMESDVVVNVVEQETSAPVLQEKTVTSNGEVVPDEGYDGLSKVTVEVSGGSCDGTHVIEVEELPTENIDENAVYLCVGKYYKWANEFTDVIMYDGGAISFKELLTQIGATSSVNAIPTKTTDGVLISDIDTLWHFYYIEDEADVFIYSDDWYSLSDMGMINGGAISDISEATTEGCYYALVEKGWRVYAYATETLDITENGTYEVTDKKNVAVSVPATIIVQTVADLPTDTADGSIAFVLGGE